MTTVWALEMEISLSDATVLTVGGRSGFGKKELFHSFRRLRVNPNPESNCEPPLAHH